MRVAVDTLELGATTDDVLPSGEFYYEYVLIHVENLMVDIRIAEKVIQAIIKTYIQNKDKKTDLPYGPPDI